jgi:hypothetical protein
MQKHTELDIVLNYIFTHHPFFSGVAAGVRHYPTSNDFSVSYRGADKSLARPGRKQATATEDFEFHIPYL